MNKILNSLKYILFLITLILFIIFNIKSGMHIKILLIYISFIFLLIINIRDIKYRVKTSNRYNILYSLVMLLTIFLLCRTLYDTSLISNSHKHLILLKNINYMNMEYIKETRLEFFIQNIYYLLILYISLIIYNLISEKDKINYKYTNTSIFCLIINIFISLETINLLAQSFNINHFPLLFFAVNTILLVVEIASLIKNNKTKREWIIYLCFLFNLFAYIAIFT